MMLPRSVVKRVRAVTGASSQSQPFIHQVISIVDVGEDTNGLIVVRDRESEQPTVLVDDAENREHRVWRLFPGNKANQFLVMFHASLL